jgi:hypothetical protein
LTTTGHPAASAEAVSPPPSRRPAGSWRRRTPPRGPPDHAQPQIGAGQRLALGQGRIDAQTLPATLTHHLREEAKLAHGAATLALETGAGQAAFGHGGLDQAVAQIEDVLRDGFEKRRAAFARGGAIGIEGRLGRCAGRRHILGVVSRQVWPARLARGGGDGTECGHDGLRKGGCWILVGVNGGAV